MSENCQQWKIPVCRPSSRKISAWKEKQMKQCHTIKKKIVDYLDSICFFKNSSCSDLIIMRKGKRRKQK